MNNVKTEQSKLTPQIPAEALMRAYESVTLVELALQDLLADLGDTPEGGKPSVNLDYGSPPSLLRAIVVCSETIPFLCRDARNSIRRLREVLLGQASPEGGPRQAAQGSQPAPNSYQKL